MKKILLLALALLFAVSCSDDDNGGGVDTGRDGVGVFVCNEGQFNYDNGSLSFYDAKEGVVTNNVYERVNGVPVGDILQAMTVVDGRGYLVVNNSGKVVVIDPETFEYIGDIKGLSSPRAVIAAGSNKLYITDLYSPVVTVVDRTSLKMLSQIELTSEEVDKAASSSYVVLANWTFNDTVYKIDIATDKIVDFVTVTAQPNSMATDRNGKLWVMSDGGYEGSDYSFVKPALTRIDLASFTIEQVFTFDDIHAQPSKMQINASGDRLYFIYNSWAALGEDGLEAGVYSMGIGEQSLPSKAVVAQQAGQQFYGLGIDPADEDIYIGDAVDYQQAGYVYRYSKSGDKKGEFKAGISPTAFCFVE